MKCPPVAAGLPAAAWETFPQPTRNGTMQAFTRYSLILLAELCGIVALLATYEAHHWITEGYGLNPFAALPFATLVILMPFALARLQQ